MISNFSFFFNNIVNNFVYSEYCHCHDCCKCKSQKKIIHNTEKQIQCVLLVDVVAGTMHLENENDQEKILSLLLSDTYIINKGATTKSRALPNINDPLPDIRPTDMDTPEGKKRFMEEFSKLSCNHDVEPQCTSEFTHCDEEKGIKYSVITCYLTDPSKEDEKINDLKSLYMTQLLTSVFDPSYKGLSSLTEKKIKILAKPQGIKICKPDNLFVKIGTCKKK